MHLPWLKLADSHSTSLTGPLTADRSEGLSSSLLLWAHLRRGCEVWEESKLWTVVGEAVTAMRSALAWADVDAAIEGAEMAVVQSATDIAADLDTWRLKSLAGRSGVVRDKSLRCALTRLPILAFTCE